MYRFQYSVSLLLVVTTIVAALLGTYKWWRNVRERQLQTLIRSCTVLPESERELFCGWVQDRLLLQSLHLVPASADQLPRVSDAYVRPLAWNGHFLNAERNERHVFIFGSSSVDNEGIVVLCDTHDRLLSWSSGRIGAVFYSAWLMTNQGPPELRIDAGTVGVHSDDQSRGIYRFALADKEVSQLSTLWQPVEILKTHQAMTFLKERLLTFFRSTGRLPAPLEKLPPDKERPDCTIDGWGRKIELRFNGSRVTMISFGRDGKSGGTDDDEDIVGDFDAIPDPKVNSDRRRAWTHDPTENWVRRFH